MGNRVLMLLASLLVSFTSYATQIPPALQDWQQWALGKQQNLLTCPRDLGNKTDQPNCAWSSALTLQRSADVLNFSASWQLFEPGKLLLPGSLELWPNAVTLNGKPAVVSDDNGAPVIFAAAGLWQVSGKISWQKQPDYLSVPVQYGIVTLDGQGQVVDDGEISLQNKAVAQEADSLTLSVFRRIRDGQPTELTSQILIEVAGQPREVTLPNVVPAGLVISSLSSELSSQLTAQGELKVKLLPGVWQLTFEAYAPPAQLSFVLPTRDDAYWPSQEMWFWLASNYGRSAELTGGSFTSLVPDHAPTEWTRLPAYVVNAGQTLELNVLQRGLNLSSENDVTLQRELWLDFTGKQWDFADTLTGSVQNIDRLAMAAPYRLDNVAIDDEPQTITQLSDSEYGLEIRSNQVNVKASGQLPRQAESKVLGWQMPVNQMNLTVNLPPASRLMAVWGADTDSGSWLSYWDIWHCFIVLALTIVVFKFIHRGLAALVFMALLLLLQEPNAHIGLLINVIVARLLVQYQPFSALKKLFHGYWLVSCVLFVIAVAAYSIFAIRTSLYPQLEQSRYQNMAAHISMQQAREDKDYAEEAYLASRAKMAVAERVKRVEVTGSRIALPSQEPELNVQVRQTGNGTPAWQWRQYRVSWQAPVSAEQSWQLWLLAGWQYVLFKLLGLLALLAVTALLAKRWFVGQTHTLWPSKQATALLTGLPVLLLSATMFVTPNSQASDLPNEQMLETLKNTLLEAPLCAPKCAQLQEGKLSITADTLTAELTFHSQQLSAVPLPHAEHWLIDRAQWQTGEAAMLTRRNGQLLVYTPSGISTLTLSGRLLPMPLHRVRFTETPKHLQIASLAGWQLSGLTDDRLQDDAITLQALAPQAKATPTASDNNAAVSVEAMRPLVLVNRYLRFNSRWQVRTVVRRLAPSIGTIAVSVPLLAQEQVQSDRWSVANGDLQLSMASDEQEVAWTSILTPEQRSALTLTASSDSRLVEVWSVEVDAQWHYQFSGVPVLSSGQTREFYPYAGEQLALNFAGLATATGTDFTVDSLDNQFEVGERSNQWQLKLSYRSSSAKLRSVPIADGYSLKQAEHDGQTVNLQVKDQQVFFTSIPGEHQLTLHFSQNQALTAVWQSPTLNWQTPTTNISTHVDFSGQRWLLWLNGPTLGPVVLYWGELLAYVLIALALTRAGFAPLQLWQWLLLGLGFSVNQWAPLVLLVIWFAAMTWAGKRADSQTVRQFQIGQVGLLLLSLLMLLSMIGAVPGSLLGLPDMAVQGNGSYGHSLHWFADKTAGALPQVTVLSVSVWWYKLLMLVWVLWFVSQGVSWWLWGWRKLTVHGFWREAPKSTPAPAATPEQASRSATEVLVSARPTQTDDDSPNR